MTKSVFTPALDARLVDLYRRGEEVKAIADAIGVNLSSVHSRIHKLRRDGVDLPFRPTHKAWPELSAEEDAEVLRLRCELRLGGEAIAERLGRPVSTVFAAFERLRRAGHDVPRQVKGARWGAAKVEATGERAARTIRRECNLCPTVFVTDNPYRRFCDACRREGGTVEALTAAGEGSYRLLGK